MNHCVPDWNMEDDSRSLLDLLPTANQKKSMASDNELIELLWRNGHVVMHNQTHRKPPTTVTEFRQAQKPEPLLTCGGSLGNSSDLIQEDETASWFQYPLDDSLDKEFCSEFFCEMPVADAAGADKLNKVVAIEGEKYVKFGDTEESNVFTGSASEHSNPCLHENTMPPPKSHATGSNQRALSLGNGGIINFSHFSWPVKGDLGFSNGQLGQKGSGNGIQGGIGESSSMMTMGSSACGSNQVQNLVNESHTFSNDAAGALARSVKEDVQTRSLCEGVQTNTYEATVTSSSGGSGCSFGRMGQQSARNQSHKRKGRDGEESECHSEEADYESIEANKPSQRSASARRTRAAEVHNLSERKRRDRINEKMKALQELIPHCNKSDKASMLDEAIEYLKSLQLQVQIMWMGSGMAPMMFPGVQQYMSRMGMGMSHAPLPSIHSPIQLPRVPLVNHSIPSASTANHTTVCPYPALNPVSFPTQMQNVHLPESYARYLGFHHMQPPPQAMNLYTYGSHTVQPNQPAPPPPPAAASSSGLPAAGAVPPEKNRNGHSG